MFLRYRIIRALYTESQGNCGRGGLRRRRREDGENKKKREDGQQVDRRWRRKEGQHRRLQ